MPSFVMLKYPLCQQFSFFYMFSIFLKIECANLDIAPISPLLPYNKRSGRCFARNDDEVSFRDWRWYYVFMVAFTMKRSNGWLPISSRSKNLKIFNVTSLSTSGSYRHPRKKLVIYFAKKKVCLPDYPSSRERFQFSWCVENLLHGKHSSQRWTLKTKFVKSRKLVFAKYKSRMLSIKRYTLKK